MESFLTMIVNVQLARNHQGHASTLHVLPCCWQSSRKILGQKSCTQILQTFHQPKQLHRGPPHKIEDMMVTKRKVIDRRTGPGARINSTQCNDMVRNTVIYFTAQSGLHLAYLNACSGRADIQSASEDHVHLKEHLTHHSGAVTPQQAEQLEKNTRSQLMSQQWKEERRLRITASRWNNM